MTARRDEVVAVVGEEVTALYERYLRASIRQFRGGQVTLLRFSLRRV
jgi:cyclopropane fatty-acyl-phospholipid synthase-like methyltransferase